jgi:hypothetical protein
MTNDELLYIIDAIGEIATNRQKWQSDYQYDKATNEFYHRDQKELIPIDLNNLYDLSI